MINQRARTVKAKKIRRDALMDSARQTFLSTMDFDLPNVIVITQNAGLAKGSFYNYFNSKEEIYFEIFKQEITQWFYSFSLKQIDQFDSKSVKLNFKKLHSNTLIKKLYPFVYMYSLQYELKRDFFSSYQDILIEKLSRDLVMPQKIVKMKFIQSLSLILGFNYGKEIHIFDQNNFQVIDGSLDYIWGQ